SSPMELYERPANMYVAGFIGSPRMSFVPVTVRGTSVSAQGLSVEVPRALEAREAFLGLRPEALRAASDGGPAVEMRVDRTEQLGADQYLYGKIGGADVIARVDPHLRAERGDLVRLSIDTRRIHLFDRTTEQAIL